MTKNEIEISILFLSTSFLSSYLNQVLERGEDLTLYDDLFKLRKKLSRLCNIYKNSVAKLEPITDEILMAIEEDTKKIKRTKKFEKKARLTGDNINVHELVLPMSLILEHQSIKNRILVLDYKVARKVIDSYDTQTAKHITNSRVLAKQFVERLKAYND